MIVRFAQRAENDLAAILDYLIASSPEGRAESPQASKKQFALSGTTHSALERPHDQCCL
jgi:plasmid stabilization system protein ParE